MSSQPSERHRQALALATAGIPVFPCVPNGKPPAVENGFLRSTTDIEQINAWWAEADYNIGVVPERAGWAVVDLDGKEGWDAWTRLVREHRGVPETYAVRTPRGGLHLYYEGSLPSTVKKLGDGVDTRGRGGYVLVPPSVVDGKPYRTEIDIDPAPLPPWIDAKLRSHLPPVSDVPEHVDQAAAERRARQHLSRMGPVLEGTRDNTAFKVACELRDLGCDPDLSLRLMQELWNPLCVPPLDDETLRIKVDSASRNAQNAMGSSASAPPSEVFGAILGTLAPEDTTVEPRSEQARGPVLRNVRELLALPDPVPLVEGIIMQGENFAIVGAPKQGKSMLALDIGMSVAYGLPVLGQLKVHKPGPVIYLSSEGETYLKQRVDAWLHDRAVLDVEAPFYHVSDLPKVSGGEEELDAYVKLLVGGGITEAVLLIMDTFSRSLHMLDENDAASANGYDAMARAIMRTFKCSLLTLAHTPVTGGRIRGNTAAMGNFDGTGLLDEHHDFQRHARGNNARFGTELLETPHGPVLRWRKHREDDKRRKVMSVDQDMLDLRRALEELNAYGEDNGVSRKVVMETAWPQGPNETDATWKARLLSKSRGMNPKMRAAEEQGLKHGSLWWLASQPTPEETSEPGDE
ncbi:MAG: bifunctional DNA primase/polymerase [Reyranella sp.]|uniref:bifunctional DNA primase/polymerase n=1 Tax=Reyranella sp. TaxID=1929291 RepID=UPI003D114FF8